MASLSGAVVLNISIFQMVWFFIMVFFRGGGFLYCHFSDGMFFYSVTFPMGWFSIVLIFLGRPHPVEWYCEFSDEILLLWEGFL